MKARPQLDSTACVPGRPLSLHYRKFESFKFWRERLTALKEICDELGPDTLPRFWLDTRKLVQWVTFWVDMQSRVTHHRKTLLLSFQSFSRQARIPLISKYCVYKVIMEICSQQTMSAAQRVLSLPELREQIFAWIHFDPDGFWEDANPYRDSGDSTHWYGRYGVLTRCAQVHSHWWHEVMPLVWENWRDYITTNMWEAFHDIEPSRRQLYANFVRTVETNLLEDENSIEATQSCLSDVVFPKLETLTFYVRGCYDHKEKLVELPVFHAPRLVSLFIDPRFEIYPDTYGVFQEEWETVFDLVAVSLPASHPVLSSCY